VYTYKIQIIKYNDDNNNNNNNNTRLTIRTKPMMMIMTMMMITPTEGLQIRNIPVIPTQEHHWQYNKTPKS
jgi:hypothetical protein